jgi:thioesterase domain-containing protein
VFGVGSKNLVNTVVEMIGADLKTHPDMPIDLMGFSRGAAIANEVAYAL